MGDKVTALKLHNGSDMPQVGLGTWQSAKGEVGAAVRAAILSGYRHVDCASSYRNEDEIGDTLQQLFDEGVVKREDLFITSKLNNPYHHREHVRPMMEKTLKDLRVEYVDLYLMHWPVAFVYVPYDQDRRGFPDDYDPVNCSAVESVRNGGSKIDRTVSIRETWEAMEELVDAGLCKAIGISNFTAPLIHDLLTYARIKPAVNQVEMHPYLQQRALVEYCAREGIAMEAYSPLGAGGFKKADEPSILADPVLNEIGDRHGVTAAQVALRWAVQRGTICIPKSVREERLKQNIDLFGFELSADDMSRIAALDRNYHYLRPNEWYGIPLFTP